MYETAGLPHPFLGSHRLSEVVLTSADVGIRSQLMPTKPEISREGLQRPKYA